VTGEGKTHKVLGGGGNEDSDLHQSKKNIVTNRGNMSEKPNKGASKRSSEMVVVDTGVREVVEGKVTGKDMICRTPLKAIGAHGTVRNTDGEKG